MEGWRGGRVRHKGRWRGEGLGVLVYKRVGGRTLVLMRKIVRQTPGKSRGEGRQRAGQRRPQRVTGQRGGGRSLRGIGGRGPGGLQGAAALRGHGRVRDVGEEVARLPGQQVDRARVQGVGGPGTRHGEAARHRRGRQGRGRQVVRRVGEISADQPVHAEPVGGRERRVVAAHVLGEHGAVGHGVSRVARRGPVVAHRAAGPGVVEGEEGGHGPV